MRKKTTLFVFLIAIVFSFTLQSQYTPWLSFTLLPSEQMDEIIGEASGETAWNTIMETGGYNKNRPAAEYGANFYEVQYIYDQLKKYGLKGVEIARFPARRPVWDGIKGELWEVKPNRRKLASYQDMTAMLASGSNTADVEADLIWVGRGSKKEMDGLEVKDKIVVTEGSISSVHNSACLQLGAAGVIGISTSRSWVDQLQIPWRGIRDSRDGKKAKFAFYLPAREGLYLKQRLLRNQKIRVHAQVESISEKFEMQNILALIPGTEPDADEVIFSAHLFEGIVKQGANDNKSGSAAILEVARVLHTLISEGRLPRPKRTIRFLWGPEYSGTGAWVKENQIIMDRTLCNINMDMVGEWLIKNKAHMNLMRTTYGNPHYINDVMENYYRFVGEGNRERIQLRGSTRYFRRIVAPTGSEEPFYYSIETHYGASDHEVFNDWAVGVPGVMMIVWPDLWYHTSGDRVDKADPTQLKRTVVIGAAAAYTIANADDSMAKKIAAETTSNGSRRLGHQLIRGLELLNNADPESLAKAYKQAIGYLKASIINEKDTLQSIRELGQNEKSVQNYLIQLQKMTGEFGETHLETLKIHMRERASQLNIPAVKATLTAEEKKASRIVPRPTARISEKGYRGYQDFINEVPQDIRKKFSYQRRNIGSTAEVNLLINGKRSVLDIKVMLDAQYQRESSIKDILNYLQILKAAGLISL